MGLFYLLYPMAKDPAFLMYYKQWIVSTAGWDADIRGWYINLLCHQADKPEGIPNDLESIAELAGVKISQYERFKLCWKHTLEAKFKANIEGKLQNGKLAEVINDRKEYSDKQATRGLIGYYIKIAKRDYGISEEQATELYQALEVKEILTKNKKERFLCFKHTLEALLINGNVIVNTNTILTNGEKKSKHNGTRKFSGNFKAQGEELFRQRAIERGEIE